MLRTLPDSHPLAAILSGAVIISFSGVWVSWAAVSPSVSAFYRVLFGSCFLALACALKRDFGPLSARIIFLSALCGLCFAADLYCWHASIRIVGPGLATILANFQVFVLAGITVVLYRQPLRFAFLAAIPLAVVGLMLIIGNNWNALSAAYRSGVLYGLAAALFYVGYILSLRRIQTMQRGLSFFYGMLLVSLASSVYLGIRIACSAESFHLGSPAALGSLLALGLFSQTIGWAVIANGLPNITPAAAGLVLLLQPALSFVWDVLIFARPTSFVQWLGVAVTLCAIYLGLRATVAKR